jgi:uncharacterized protein
VQSAAGIGFALVLGPALLAVLEPAEAVPALIVLGLALNALVLGGEGRERRIRRDDLRGLLIGAVPGVAAGVVLLRTADGDALRVLVGLAVLAAVAAQVRPRESMRPTASVRSAPAVGVLTGTLTTATSVNGPPLLLWLQARGAGPADLRDTLTAALLGLNVLGAVAVGAFGGHPLGPSLVAIAALLPLVVAGHAVGSRAFAQMHPSAFRAAGLVLAGVAGAVTLASGLA